MHSIVINEDSFESFTLLIDGKVVGQYNHDQHGWHAMEEVRNLVAEFAKILGVEVESTGDFD